MDSSKRAGIGQPALFIDYRKKTDKTGGPRRFPSGRRRGGGMGHDGHPENERCDKLATSAADGEDLIEDEGLAQ